MQAWSGHRFPFGCPGRQRAERNFMKFTDLPLCNELQRGVRALNFQACTPIQASALPLLLENHDVAGQAQTGTGKTAAFLLAVMQHLLKGGPRQQAGQPAAMVISPTRELAVQIHQDAETLGKFTGLRCALVYGGIDYGKQRARFQEPMDLLIGTPGRLIDYYRQHVYNLRAVRAMVLDEADRMFDLGFIRDVRYLLRRMPSPEKRLNMLFTATLPWRVTELAYEHMNNPEIIRINPDQVTVDGVSQGLYHVAREEKMPLLVGLFRHMRPERTLVFVNTRRVADRVHACLQTNGFEVALLTGDIPQQKRQRLFQKFSQGRLPILVATDLAARGLHVEEISHVINYDLPFNAEDYVHRIGRTARAGATGHAVSLACDEYVYSLTEIETYLKRKIPVKRVDDELLAEIEYPSQRRTPRRPARRRQRNPRERTKHTA